MNPGQKCCKSWSDFLRFLPPAVGFINHEGSNSRRFLLEFWSNWPDFATRIGDLQQPRQKSRGGALYAPPLLHPGSVSKEVPPAGYVSYFLNHSGIWREIVPCTSLSEKEPGHKNAKNGQKRQIYLEITTNGEKRRLRRQMYLAPPLKQGIWRVAVRVP